MAEATAAARDAAAEAAARLLSDFDMVMNVRFEARGVAHVALAAALPHLTAEDVPHVTAQVRAEALREAAAEARRQASDSRSIGTSARVSLLETEKFLLHLAAPPAPTEDPS